jgi:transcription elongation factor Elf1
MEITACPKCGSKKIAMGTMGVGITFGVTSWKSVCKQCGYQGEPLLFDSEEEYTKFLQGLSSTETSQEIATSEQNENIDAQDDTLDLSKKDKEVVELLHDLKEEPQRGEKKIFPEDKMWWPEIIVAMIIATIVIIITAPNLFSLYDLFLGMIYIFLFFVLIALITIIVFIVIEYLYYSIKNAVKQKTD